MAPDWCSWVNLILIALADVPAGQVGLDRHALIGVPGEPVLPGGDDGVVLLNTIHHGPSGPYARPLHCPQSG